MPGASRINRRSIRSHMALIERRLFLLRLLGRFQSPLDLPLEKHETCQTGRYFQLMSFFNHFRPNILLRRSILWRQPHSEAIKA